MKKQLGSVFYELEHQAKTFIFDLMGSSEKLWLQPKNKRVLYVVGIFRIQLKKKFLRGYVLSQRNLEKADNRQSSS